jgi:phosphoribosylformylglycinamidine cyclo-ligase
MASSGLHSNGYSLVRKVIGIAGWTIYRHVAEFGHSLGEELLVPTRVYAPDVLDLAAALGPGLHALAHVTGGGLAANLARVLPRGSEAVVDRGTWTPATIFDLIARLGTIARPEMERTFNLGVGMLAVVAPEHERETVARLTGRGVPAWRCGQVEESYVRGEAGTTAEAVVHGTKGVDGGSVRMIGDHPRA